ncbi:MAG: transglutaminase domain-containing protein, partial [Christensenellales bacterium]
AVSSNELLNSAFSNEVSFSIVPTATNLQSPNLNSVYVSGDNLVFDFEKVDENSQTFSLFINDTLLTTSISQSNNYVSLDSVFGVLGDVDSLSVCLSANSTDEYHLASTKSNIVTISTSLSTPTNVKLNGSMLSWNAVENAQTYSLILDNEIINLNSNSTSVNLTNYVSLNKARQVKLFAQTKYFTNSNIVGDIIYNNVTTAKTGYTDKYFFYGETYDYYITSQEELNNLIRYAVQNLITKVSFYIAYNTSTLNSDKIDKAYDNLTGTYGFSASSDGGSSTSGKCSIDFTYYSISTYDGHSATYQQYSKTYQYKSTVGRDSNYDNFASDKWFVNQDVYTSDGLVVALENSARPNFIGSNSSAQQVYNKAKQILIEICDDSMTDYQKALAIHDYIVFNTSYDDYGLANTANNTIGYYHYIESVFDNGFAVCDGYAKAFSLLCNMEGIKTITISGATDSENISSTGHAWNKIYLDADGNGTKEWLSVDLTWDDGRTSLNGTTYEILSHEYFMIPDNYIGERYEQIDYPDSETFGMTYYDIFTIDGNSIKVDTLLKYNALVTYFKSSDYSGIEILLDKNISASVTGITTYTYSNYFDEDYKRVYLVK